MEIQTRDPRSGRLRRRLITALSIASTIFAIAFILPTAFGMQRYVITGTSMSGTFEVGSLVFSEVVPTSELQVGDVITYMPPPESGIDHLVTHRIVKIRPDGSMRTQGDAIGHIDPWAFKLGSATQPRVRFDVPYLGWLLMALQERQVRIALIAFPAALIALRSLLQIVSVLRQRGGSDTPSDARHNGVVTESRVPVSVGG